MYESFKEKVKGVALGLKQTEGPSDMGAHMNIFMEARHQGLSEDLAVRPT